MKQISKWYVLTLDEEENLNPPILDMKVGFDGICWRKELDDPQWLNVGYIPRPQSHIAWFLYHLIHGLAMKYPLHKIFLYALFNTLPKEIYGA